ncbi:glycosyltransferase family 4 protein [Halomonas sp. M20]|uniref:glycosyltransferase family 4 protein n=1 Tax=Halomonas sp. M20 TaxID=2763264 RepID=UPI001D0AEF3B|nr:glycosyltransferase family 4 protein [Halomonas sp. M20]
MDILFIAGNARSLIANRGDLIREMQSKGLVVAAAVPERDYLPEVEELGITIFRFEMGRTGINPLSDIKTFFSLFRLMRKKNPKAVFCYTIKPVVYGSLAAKLAGVPKIFSMITGLGHVFTTQNVKTGLVRKIVAWLYKLSLFQNDVIFFQNPDDEREFRQLKIINDTAKVVRTNGSGVDTEKFALSDLPSGNPVFMFIGRLLTEKGIIEYVEAAKALRARYQDVTFIAVGPHDPSLPHSIDQALLDDWKNNSCVEFIGSVSDVRPCLAKCSVFVLPSYREGTPRSVLEAMSMGRAIVTSDAPGCRETVIDGNNGFLVAPRSADSLADAMEKFIIEPTLIGRMAQESRRLAEEKYDVKKVNKVILNAMGYI